MNGNVNRLHDIRIDERATEIGEHVGEYAVDNGDNQAFAQEGEQYVLSACAKSP